MTKPRKNGDEKLQEPGADADYVDDEHVRWWTRAQVATELGLSIASIRRLEELGTLHPVLRRGVNFFDSREVRALARKRASVSPFVRAAASLPERPSFRRSDGHEAAEVFQLLNQDKSLRDIVIEACVPPARVRALYSEWRLSLEDGERQRESHPSPQDCQAGDEVTRRRGPGRPRKIRTLGPDYELPPSDDQCDDTPLPDLGVLAAAAEHLFDDKD